jgi:hypothetical protein
MVRGLAKIFRLWYSCLRRKQRKQLRKQNQQEIRMAKKPKASPFIIDEGNGSIKVSCPDGEVKEFSFPHAFTRLSQADYTRITARVARSDPDYMLINGTPYAFGAKGLRHGKMERKHGAARYKKDYYGVFLAAAMAKGFQRSVDNVFVMGSHAPGDADYALSLMEAAAGTWVVEHMDNVFTFNVADASTFDEPLGGWANCILRADGEGYANKSMNDGTTLTIDIGALTVDGLVIDAGGSPDYAYARSEKCGVLAAVDQFIKDFRSANAKALQNVPTLNEEMVHQAIRTGKMDLRGLGVIDCPDLASELRVSLVNDVLALYDGFGGGAEFDYLLFTGGGAALLHEELIKMIDHNAKFFAVPTRDFAKMHMANVRGGAKWYRMHEKLGSFA